MDYGQEGKSRVGGAVSNIGLKVGVKLETETKPKVRTQKLGSEN